MKNGGTAINVDLTGFAERYAADPSAVEALCREQSVSAPTVYKAMRRARIPVRKSGAASKPGQKRNLTAEDDRWIRRHFPSKKTIMYLCANLPSGPCHRDVLLRRARSLSVRRNTVRNDAHYSNPGPKIRTSDAPPVPVLLANVIQWLRAAGHNVRRDIKPGLWTMEPGSILTPRMVVALANDLRTRHAPKALPLFDCDFSGLKGQDDAV